jgi:hypothetical protein
VASRPRTVHVAERPELLLKEGSLQDRFLQSTAKVQIYGGGFGNGKTTAAVIKALQLADKYPGSTGLISRSTYPKLNDTIRKEFIKWCPPKWIVSFSVGQNGDNICYLKNGTSIYFRYIAQQGTKTESSSSNLLSATFDWVIVDQVEDPEITHKDFLDLFGRLRGRARYVGEDAAYPITGPRWMMLTCNPTGNWVYTKLVRPLQIYNNTGMITDELICERDVNRQPVLGDDGKPKLWIEVIEGSTYELRHVHDAEGGDFIATLETMYSGQQRDRFLLGRWVAYEGLVYPQFDNSVHLLQEGNIRALLDGYIETHYQPNWIEAYDYGQAQPSCYTLAFVSPEKHVIICDGFYRKEFSLEEQVAAIKRIRREWEFEPEEMHKCIADPSIFGRRTVGKRTIGKTIADMFKEDGIYMRRGNNDIANGVVKVGSYLNINHQLLHPINRVAGSPRLFVNAKLDWWIDECTGYFWQQSTSGERIDKPMDRNDHAMDNVRYLLSDMPDIGKYNIAPANRVPSYMMWQERDHEAENPRRHRYG